jgi:Chaperone of endosialidase
MKKQSTIKKILFSIGLCASASVFAQAWDATGNDIFGSSVFGTKSTSPIKPVVFITNGAARVILNNSYRTDFIGSSRTKIDGDDITSSVIQSFGKFGSRNLALFASPINSNDFPASPSGDIYMKSKNIFMQYSDALAIEGSMTQKGKVFIGEPTTFAPLPFTPVLQVRGDNIGLVRVGAFGDAITTGTSQWLALGFRPSTTLGFNSYGIRSQWDYYAVDLAERERAIGATKDAVLTWQDATFSTDICATTLSSKASALRFVFRNGDLPSGIGSSLEVGTFLIQSPSFGGATCKNLGFLGINNTKPKYELDVNGNINSNSSVIASGVILTSDARFKKDIKPIGNGLEIVRQLNPVNYNFKTEEFKSNYNFSSALQYGFIAQDLEKVIPSTVTELQDGYKGVNYVMLIPILTNAIKSMDTKMSAMETELQALKGENTSMKRALGNGSNNSSNENTGSIKLLQNVPNPFGNSTIIEYALGNDNKGIKLVVADLSGKTIQVFENLESNGKVEVKAESLNNGIYLYSLVNANNEVMMSKQMLVQK